MIGGLVAFDWLAGHLGFWWTLLAFAGLGLAWYLGGPKTKKSIRIALSSVGGISLLVWMAYHPQGRMVVAGLCGIWLVAVAAQRFSTLIFLPGDRFHEVPEEQLARLRRIIEDGQLVSAEQQLQALLEAYGPNAGVYHLLAHSFTRRGVSSRAIAHEAHARLDRKQRDKFAELMRNDPPPNPAKAEWRPAHNVPGFYERIFVPPPVAAPEPLALHVVPPENYEGAPLAPTPKLKLRLRPQPAAGSSPDVVG